MFESREAQRRIGRLAWVMAWVALVVGQLHALARHQTEDGKADLDLPLTAFWAEPAGDALRPLLDWASPDAVYLTYGKLWLPVFVAFTLCAFVVRRRRQPVGVEKWAWRVALTGYTLACVAVAAEYWAQWGAMNDGLLEVVFLASVPIMLLTMLGSSFLGIVLLRRGLRLPAWLLAFTFPLVLVITAITSLGNVVLPIAFAFGILGRRVALAEQEPELQTTPVAA
ncbi:hypothetical protein [Nocardioides taihuensis]|uniref:DUF2029 domain-containing protein n=1 Tax=Nocardioides taihuensis TaxID=1835606 RepID=A0ABW0BL75_9ACTN